MCGRIYCDHEPLELAEMMGIVDIRGAENYSRRFNVPPSSFLPVLVANYEVKDDEKSALMLQYMKWGLPSGRIDTSNTIINARAETLLKKGTFKNLCHKNRCVLVIDGYYEWQVIDKLKVPYYISINKEATQKKEYMKELSKFVTIPKEEKQSHKSLMYLACIFQHHNNQYYFTIVTTEANKTMSTVHDRMPVILEEPSHVRAWLNCDDFTIQDTAFVLPSVEKDCINMKIVSDLVNNVKNESKDCILSKEEMIEKSKKTGINVFFKSPQVNSSSKKRPLIPSPFQTSTELPKKFMKKTTTTPQTSPSLSTNKKELTHKIETQSKIKVKDTPTKVVKNLSSYFGKKQ